MSENTTGKSRMEEFQDPLENYEPKTYEDPLEQALAEETVAAIQSQPYVSVSPDTPIYQALERLASLHVACLLIEEDGSSQHLSYDDFTITAIDSWASPHSGAVYPSGWAVSINLEAGDPLAFNVTPLMRDQELNSGGIVYWEGAVQVSGDVSGYGYAELTGYVDAMTGRF